MAELSLEPPQAKAEGPPDHAFTTLFLTSGPSPWPCPLGHVKPFWLVSEKYAENRKGPFRPFRDWKET